LCLCFPVPAWLTLSPSLSASQGTTGRLNCTLSRGLRVGSYYIYWFQQMSESPPQYLCYCYSDSRLEIGSRVSSCNTGSKDASANAGLLLISGLQAEDEADCYC
ncbi:hypothetical protein PANDA_022234, partial [Ailuropoda melanoleuca]